MARSPGGCRLVRLTFARISTDDLNGMVRTYVGEGSMTDDLLDTFGSRAVVSGARPAGHVEVSSARMDSSTTAAMNQSHTAAVLAEAFETYMGWDVYVHEA